MSDDGKTQRCYQWPRECTHFDDLDCLTAEPSPTTDGTTKP